MLCDGWQLRIYEPYNSNPRLYVRQPGKVESESRGVSWLSRHSVEMMLGDDDCYLSEISTFVDVVEGGLPRESILSTFSDAVESYKLTWAIRLEGERVYKERCAT